MKGHELQSAWTDDNWPFTAEQDRSVFLHLAREAFSADQTNRLPAFEALAIVAAFYWRSEEAPETVSIPFWAVEAIVAGYHTYQDSHKADTGSKLKFGEAFEVEGRGQGKRPRIHEYLKLRRDIRIAIHIVLLEEEGWKIDAAVQQLAASTSIHHNTIRNIWTERAEQARKALALFRSNPPSSAQTS